MEKKTLSAVIVGLNANVSTEVLKDTIAIVKEYVANSANDGRFGNAFETITNCVYNGIAIHRKPANMVDVKVLAQYNETKRTLSIETKINAGMFNKHFDNKTDAIKFVENPENLVKLIGTKYFQYNYDFKHVSDYETKTRIMTTKAFVSMLYKYRLVRVKPQTGKGYTIAIQNFMPTPSFTGLNRRFEFIDEFLANGVTVEQFIANGMKLGK